METKVMCIGNRERKLGVDRKYKGPGIISKGLNRSSFDLGPGVMDLNQGPGIIS